MSCSGFIDFATSGLETPMTMLFVYVAYRTTPVLDRPVRAGMALGLAYLCHPDVAVLALGPSADRGSRRRASVVSLRPGRRSPASS